MVEYSGTNPLFGTVEGAEDYLSFIPSTPEEFLEEFCNCIIPKTKRDGTLAVDRLQARVSQGVYREDEILVVRKRSQLNHTFSASFMKMVDECLEWERRGAR